MPQLSSPPPTRLSDLPTRLAVALGKGLARLPWRAQLALGRVLGTLLGWLLRGRRQVAQRNLELCFPELDAAARQQLLKQSFAALGIGVFEFMRAWWGDIDSLRQRTRIEGLEGLQKLRDEGRGILLVSGHFLTLELCGRLLCDHAPLAGMYRAHDHRWMEFEVLRGRLRYAAARLINWPDYRAQLWCHFFTAAKPMVMCCGSRRPWRPSPATMLRSIPLGSIRPSRRWYARRRISTYGCTSASSVDRRARPSSIASASTRRV